MTQEHPITPPEELVREWLNTWDKAKVKHVTVDHLISLLMENNKKIFLVTLQYRGYVVAADDYDAEDIGLSIAQYERPSVEVEEVRSNVLRWPSHACVYHAEQMDRDITVAECFPAQ
jgi:hypothetical protein